MEVLRLRDVARGGVAELLRRYGLELVGLAAEAAIPGSFWGAPEAGLVGSRLYARGDTPLHSILHEAAHFVCMSPQRRRGLDTDAGGDDLEECAVCYLQVLLAGHLEGFGRERAFADMDRWGYSFRLGAARAWFDSDAEDARAWLVQHRLIDAAQRPGWRLR